VWATTLAADQHQYLTAAASADKLILDLDALGADGLDGRDYYDSDEELYVEDRTAPVLSSRSPAVVWNPAKPKPPDWRKQLGEVFQPRDRAAWPSKLEILYVVDVAKNMHGGGLVLSLQSRNQNANGSFSRPKVLSMRQGQVAQLPLSEDREILSAVPGGQSYSYGYGYAGTYLPIPESPLLSPALASMLMPLVARTGRCFLRPLNEPDNLLPLAWDEGGPWNCRLFLVSMKAGGLGLNLTAAEYVFILDPWWNPAVEAQAVDRAHRIGQMRPIFTYRLIARDTVEEKVLELQKTKRDLAAAIMGAENSMIRDLCSEDLALLLS
jgi:hypothetical protein